MVFCLSLHVPRPSPLTSHVAGAGHWARPQEGANPASALVYWGPRLPPLLGHLRRAASRCPVLSWSEVRLCGRCYWPPTAHACPHSVLEARDPDSPFARLPVARGDHVLRFGITRCAGTLPEQSFLSGKKRERYLWGGLFASLPFCFLLWSPQCEGVMLGAMAAILQPRGLSLKTQPTH